MTENEWTARLRDAILDNSALRNGLTDDQAQPLIDWGLAMVETVTANLPTMPADIAETRYEQLYGALPKLMTRITWVVVHRAKKGPAWTEKTLRQLNELNVTLHGEDAPQLSGGALMGYSQQMDGLEGLELIQALMEQLTPASEEPPIDVTHTQPDEETPNGETQSF